MCMLYSVKQTAKKIQKQQNLNQDDTVSVFLQLISNTNIDLKNLKSENKFLSDKDIALNILNKQKTIH